jgi:hypothetical protein
MTYAPIARILIRYGVGLVLGAEAADLMAGDVDVVSAVAMAIGVMTEAAYTIAKRKGWAT